MELSSEDYSMIIDGLEALKTKDFSKDLMLGMMESMLIKPDKMSPEKRAEYEKEQEKKEEEKKIEKIAHEELKRKISVLKSKMILAQDELLSKA